MLASIPTLRGRPGHPGVLLVDDMEARVGGRGLVAQVAEPSVDPSSISHTSKESDVCRRRLSSNSLR